MVYGNAVCRGLRHFGIECRFRPRHDFMVGNRKVGTADTRIDRSGAVIFHAHVLLDFDAQEAARLLRLPSDMTLDSAAAALSARLSSLRHEKGQAVEPSTVREFMRVAFEAGFGVEFQEFPITPLENDGITQLQRERYAAQAWLDECSAGPQMTGAAGRQTPGGLLLAFASRVEEQIGSVLLAGDFFGDWDAVEKFQDSLRGVPASPESIRAAADQSIGPGALENVDSADIVDAVLEALSAAAHAPALPDQPHGLPQSFL